MPTSGQKNRQPTSTRWTCISSCSVRRVAAWRVPAGEVERPRRDDVEQERQRREGQHLRHPRVQHGQQPAPRAARGRVRSASVTGAPSARDSGTSIDSTMCWTMCTLSSVVSYVAEAGRRSRSRTSPIPTAHERERPAHRPAVAAAAQGDARRPGRGRPPRRSGRTATGCSDHPVRTRPEGESGEGSAPVSRAVTTAGKSTL